MLQWCWAVASPSWLSSPRRRENTDSYFEIAHKWPWKSLRESQRLFLKLHKPDLNHLHFIQQSYLSRSHRTALWKLITQGLCCAKAQQRFHSPLKQGMVKSVKAVAFSLIPDFLLSFVFPCWDKHHDHQQLMMERVFFHFPLPLHRIPRKKAIEETQCRNHEGGTKAGMEKCCVLAWLSWLPQLDILYSSGAHA